MMTDKKLGRALIPLLLLASGCGDEGAIEPEIHARGSIEAFGGTPGETQLIALYSSKLDDEACEARDAVSECVLLRCLDETRALEDAGEVSVDGHELELDTYNSYHLVVPEELVPGEAVEMRASGSSAVPKHGGEVVVPSRAELTSELAEFPVLERTEDFLATWDPVVSDRVIFRLTFDAFKIECATAGTSGQITIPARLLAQLPEETPGAFSITNENLVEKSVSGWRLWFRAHQVVVATSVELVPP